MMRTGSRRARARAVHWQYDSVMPDTEARVNFSIHLPDPLLADLDAFAQTRQTSRSGVIREAVREYLARHALQAWPADLECWMREPLPTTAEQWPGLRCLSCRDERGDAPAHCPKGRALMRYLLDTNAREVQRVEGLVAEDWLA